MKTKPFKSVILYLGSNFWQKKGGEFPVDPEEFIYRDKMYFDKATWDKVVDSLPEYNIDTVVIALGEGVVYDSHPELAVEGSWSKEMLKAELAKLKKMGIRAIPYENFSPTHNAWLKDYTYMVGTQKYMDICADIVKDVIDMFDTPDMFHLGFGTEGYQAKYLDSKHFPITIVCKPFILAQYTKALFDICRARGVRPWMWADMKTVEEFGGDEEFCRIIPKDVILSSQYVQNPISIVDIDGKPVIKTMNSEMEHFKKLSDWGYTQIPAVTRRLHPSSPKNVILYTSMECKNIEGYLAQTLSNVVERKFYALMNCVQNFDVAYNTILDEEGNIHG